MEWDLKVRNQAMKQGCAAKQLDAFKQSLFMVRTVVNTIVQAAYIVLQMGIALFKLLIPSTGGKSAMAQVMTEINFWFNKLILLMVEAIKQLANMLFNLIFSSGPLGQALKSIVMWLCQIMQSILSTWNNTGAFFYCVLYKRYW